MVFCYGSLTCLKCQPLKCLPKTKHLLVLRPGIVGMNLWALFSQSLDVVGAVIFKVSGRLLCCIMDGERGPTGPQTQQSVKPREAGPLMSSEKPNSSCASQGRAGPQPHFQAFPLHVALFLGPMGLPRAAILSTLG